MAAPEDVNVDELRRRARRRLVGAIVLALAVAVFVPMLLESDPKPLGEDVSVKIPPVDEGKFVNRLNEKGKAEPAKAAAKSEPKPEPPKTETVAEPAKASEPAEPAKTEVAKAEPAKAEAPSAAMPPPAPAPAPAAEPAPKAAAVPPAPREAASGEFSVQLAAFSDDKGANALANKLKKAGYPAYTEPLSTSRGTLWRVRVGPYASRDSAVASREKLKGEGYSGIVAAAK
jgi:DedD protein